MSFCLFIFSIFRNIMKIVHLNQNGFIYFMNMTILLITYFLVRILSLPLILHLYASTTGYVTPSSISEHLSYTLRNFSAIPIKCQLGCVVMYSLQLYWFLNIFRSWIRTALKQINFYSLLNTRNEPLQSKQNLVNDAIHKKEKKLS